jgi:Flp pilus assembly pilin Flp
LASRDFLWKSSKRTFDKGLEPVHHVTTSGCCEVTLAGGEEMSTLVRMLWTEDAGQDIAEYAVMLAVILVLVVGTVRLIGSNANNAFSQVASSIQ